MHLTRLLRVSAFGIASLGFGTPAFAQEVTSDHEYDALGRLIASEDTNGDARSYCYDEAGNRTEAKGSTSGAVASCPAPPAPSAPPSGGGSPGGGTGGGNTSQNNPPITVSDTLQMPCSATVTVNLTSNDSDPDGDTPLALQSIDGGGLGFAQVISNSSVEVTSSNEKMDHEPFEYVVSDSLGLTSTGILTVSTPKCFGDPGDPGLDL